MNCHVPTPVLPRDLAGKARTSFDRGLGARVVAARKAKGLSQTDLGRASGVTFQQIQKYERGQNRISAGRLVAFARALDVPASVLLDDGADEGTKPGSALGLLALPGAPEWLRAYAQTDPAVRASLLSLVRDMARPAPAAEA